MSANLRLGARLARGRGGEGKRVSLIATGGPSGGFVGAAEPHRRELFVHCYQMLGSVHDAQDLVQETMERGWRADDRDDPQLASMRTWLYRIATNACLNALQARARRPLPSGVGQPFEDPDAPFVPGFEVSWLEPFPDQLFGGPPQDPEMLAIEHNRLRLALVGALQLLSAKQRAVLILRDVLDFSAAETAEALDISIAAAIARCSGPALPFATTRQAQIRSASPIRRGRHSSIVTPPRSSALTSTPSRACWPRRSCSRCRRCGTG